ncbi:prepilin-type N-terminal cleavage/methylation domain-containing protein [Desulfurobacterium pacificum]|nr:prepilin-type N-terminal cleavage/methylation domain-containing protein [Desulfurobacterium pacificum]
MLKRRNGGFSLIELLLVLIVLIIITSISAFGVYKLISYYKVRTFSEKLYSELEYARSLAYQKGSSEFRIENGYCNVYAPVGSSIPVVALKIPENVNVTLSLSFSSVNQVFKRNGLPYYNGTINVSGYGFTFKIVMDNISGRIYLEKG